ncbi:unnamed protein product [[Candida] boidinii]|uniref:Protein phosphatase methylesterase 1 n=1 Tax=Candida boidinii TaxID=5477 RepID=A0A9W6SX05_CANBO|nr:hypothetical protein B5S30_g1600 [[Candida] boidinii]OWB84952.1 hypothetical protein B5S33_g3609 [[Candida] boidinii]GME68280.1 unnamed protein product [[Candida] boidinii]
MSDFQKRLFQNKLRQAEKSLGLDFDKDNDNDNNKDYDNDNDTITNENNGIISSDTTPTNSDQAGLYGESMSPSYDYNPYHDQQDLEEEEEGEEEEGEEEDEEESDLLGDLLPPRGPFSKQPNSKIPNINKNGDNTTTTSNKDTTFYPKWSDFFQKNEIITDDSKNYRFQTYYNPPNIPNVNNTDNNSNNNTTNSFNPELNDYENEPVIFIAHHGAGSSGLTFAYLAKSINEISKRQYIQYNPSTNPRDIPSPGFFCYDARGHGNTNLLNQENNSNTDNTNNENYNLSIEQLTQDFINVISKFYDSNFAGKAITPHFFLIGHSLGGSVLTNCLHDLKNGLFKSRPDIYSLVKGLTMIDIVEETAIKSLHHMNTFLNNLPKNFNTLSDSINWHMKNNLINNLNSARISIPSYLFKDAKDSKYYWICKLNQTEPFWFNWFKNLSSNFIKLPNKISKLLILANNDNLDKDLMIGQMQGKYQLVVFRNNSAPISTANSTSNPTSAHAHQHQQQPPQTTTFGIHSNGNNGPSSVPTMQPPQQQQQFITTTATKSILVNDNNHISHFVHEDVPDKTAITLLEYIERNDFNHLTIKNSKSTTQLNYLNKLNAKWGVKN